jgi:hypothetical protein
LENPYDTPKARLDDGDAPPSFLAARPKHRLFQWLVGLSIPLYLIFFFVPDTWLTTSREMLDLRALGGYGAMLPPVAGRVVVWILLPLWILAAVGMFFFQAWSRSLFLGLYVFTLLLSFFQGATVLLPVESFLSELIAVLDGAILILAYTEPLDATFRRKKV